MVYITHVELIRTTPEHLCHHVESCYQVDDV